MVDEKRRVELCPGLRYILYSEDGIDGKLLLERKNEKKKENLQPTLLLLIQSSRDVSHKCTYMYLPFETLL